eukprot:1277823-Amphidinium_carterae.1
MLPHVQALREHPYVVGGIGILCQTTSPSRWTKLVRSPRRRSRPYSWTAPSVTSESIWPCWKTQQERLAFPKLPSTLLLICTKADAEYYSASTGC